MRIVPFCLLLLTIPGSCSRLDALPDPSVPELSDTLRILAIGNSFSADAVEQNLWELFHEAGIPAVIGNIWAPGSYLSHHWNRAVEGSAEYNYYKRTHEGVSALENQTLLQGVQDQPWDFISLQQAGDLSGLYDTYFPYLPDLMTWLGSYSGAEIVFHQTWAFPAYSTQAAFANYGNDQQVMYGAIMDAVSRATKECSIRIVIPSGTAVQNARTALGDTMNVDGLHLEQSYGRFLAACVWFETFSGIDVRTNPFCPSSVPEDIAKICREAAHRACLQPYEVTPIP